MQSLPEPGVQFPIQVRTGGTEVQAEERRLAQLRALHESSHHRGARPEVRQRERPQPPLPFGLDADLVRATFACIGVPIEFKTGAWSGLIPAAMSGQIDVMWDTLLYTPERAKRMDFVAYMNSATAIIVPKGNPKKIKAVSDMCGLTGTANLGTTQEAMLRAGSAKCVAAARKPIDIITSTDMPAGLRLVQNSRADATLTNRFVGDIVAGPAEVSVA